MATWNLDDNRTQDFLDVAGYWYMPNDETSAAQYCNSLRRAKRK